MESANRWVRLPVMDIQERRLILESTEHIGNVLRRLMRADILTAA